MRKERVSTTKSIRLGCLWGAGHWDRKHARAGGLGGLGRGSENGWDMWTFRGLL